MPYEMYMVSATQADKAKDNEILVMGLKNLTALNKVSISFYHSSKITVVSQVILGRRRI